MSDHAVVRGARGRRTPPECDPRRVVDRFPAANWIPLSYQHPSRTWRIEVAGSKPATVYLKVSETGSHARVADERERLLWAGAKLPVPSVTNAGDDDGLEWMLLAPLPGIEARTRVFTAPRNNSCACLPAPSVSCTTHRQRCARSTSGYPRQWPL
jgi:aminoglycoside phosphotransferase